MYRRTLAYASLHYYGFFSKRRCLAHGICEFTLISTSKNTKSTMPKCTGTRVQIPPNYSSDESYDVHSSIRSFVKSRENFGDALDSKTRYRPTMSTIATTREDIAYDPFQRA